MSTIDAVIFDLDGTLIESEQVWRDVRHAFVVEHGGRWHDGAQAAMIGMRTAEWAAYVHDELRVALPPGEIERLVVRLVVDGLRTVPILPGAQAALERMSAAFALGLATSSARPVAESVLATTGWRTFFRVVVSADDVARGKPEPDAYERALELLGVRPARAAAIEDSTNGIRSADAADLSVIAIPNHEFPPAPQALALATRVLAKLDELTPGVVLSAAKHR